MNNIGSIDRDVMIVLSYQQWDRSIRGQYRCHDKLPAATAITAPPAAEAPDEVAPQRVV